MCVCVLFSCLNQERRNGRNAGCVFVFLYTLDSLLGKAKDNTLLLQHENLQGTSPFTFVFYGTTAPNKHYFCFAINCTGNGAFC